MRRMPMKLTAFATYQGKRVIRWPLVALFALLSALAGAMACFLFIVTADGLKLPIDLVYQHPTLFIICGAICIAATAMLISFWVHRRASAGKLQELEPPLTGNFLKRTFGRFIFACACFATLIAAFYAVENW